MPDVRFTKQRFKSAILNTFEDLNDSMPKEINKSMIMTTQKTGNINYKKNQTEILRLKSTTEMKNLQEGLNNRSEQVERRTTELDDRTNNTIQSEEKKGKRIKTNEQSIESFGKPKE